MTVNELLGILGNHHNNGDTNKQIRVFVTDESIKDASRKSGLEIKNVYLDVDAYPKAELVIEV